MQLSSKVHLTGLEKTQRTNTVDVELQFDFGKSSDKLRTQFAGQPYYISPYSNKCGHPLIKAWRDENSGAYYLVDENRVEFYVTPTGNLIQTRMPSALKFQKVVDSLFYLVLVFVLRLQGHLCLYSAVLGLRGFAIALIGYSYSGKSMLTAALAARGMSVLSDDLLVLKNTNKIFFAQPGYPWISLRPMALKETFNQLVERPQLSAEWTFQGDSYISLDLRQNDLRFEDEPLPLKAAYFIDTHSGDPTRPRIKSVSAQRAMLDLLAHSWSSPMLDKKIIQHDFNELGKLTECVVFRSLLQPHSDKGGIPTLCHLIIRDIEYMISAKGQPPSEV